MDQSASGKGKQFQTKQEYGHKITSKSGGVVSGAHYKHGKSHIILVKRQGTQAGTNKIIKHEVGHIRK